MFSVRFAYVHEAAEIRELVFSLAHYFLPDGQKKLPDFLQQSLSLVEFTSRLQSETYSNLVCVQQSGGQSRIVGYLCLKEASHLTHLFVAANYHRLGIAKQLWQTMLRELSAVQVHLVKGREGSCNASTKKITVRSSIYAKESYEKLGFSVSNQTSPIQHYGGIDYVPMVYELLLD